jgi:16S rRNA G966 N2-methylase RsmD
MMTQLSLLQDTTIKKTIKNVPINELSLSQFNPRQTRTSEQIEKLAQRIANNGFEITRALWVYQNGNGFDVFAGGTRLEAAKRAGCKTIPVVIHEGVTDDDVVRLAYEDNDNDSYHEPVSIVDVWANYAELKELGWKQKNIAIAVCANEGRVSERISWHYLSDETKEFFQQGVLDEGHLREITSNFNVEIYLSDWFTAARAYYELATISVKKSLTVRQTKAVVTKWREFITLAETLYAKLDEKWRQEFIALLAETEARSKAAVQSAYNTITHRRLEEIQAKEMELAKQQSEAEAKRLRLEQEKAKAEQVETVLENIYLGDFYDICQEFADNSIDVILTDPPYPEKFIPEYGRLAEVASRILKPGGFLLAMAGQSYLPEIINKMTPHLNYHWLISYQTPGGQSPQIWPKGINAFWKPVLWFIKGEYQKEDWFGDVVSSRVNDNDKRYHEDWGQSESGIGQLVEKYTQPGSVILDPFFGGGTLGVVCLEVGRQFVGIEKNKEQYEIARERIFNHLTGGSNG